MKNVILVVCVLCSFTSYVSQSYADDRINRGEIKLGGAYGQGENRFTGRLDNGQYSPTFKRLGIDLSFTYFKRLSWVGAITEVYFVGLTKNFNDETEVDESLFQFGYRWGVGMTIKNLTSRSAEFYLIPTFSLLSMSVDTALGPAWNPQLGINMKLGIIYARFFYYGNISHEKHGSGIMISVGLLYPSEDL